MMYPMTIQEPSTRKSSPTTAPPPAAERAYKFVKAAILDGRFDAGEMLSEVGLANEIGMSRTPMREAFSRLEVEGFINLYPKRGALVVPISPTEIREVYEARELIEYNAAQYICALSQEERDSIGDYLDSIINDQRSALDANDLGTYAQLDAAFHQKVMDYGGNSLLANFGHTLRERQQRFTQRAIGRSAKKASKFVAQHEHLASALRTGNAENYHDVITAHLSSSRKQL
ncbi:GntR family transcriptional regulator [Corynebacterium incognita]|nr:GntR family transcriptional regulator [Corynebacterium incognita]